MYPDILCRNFHGEVIIEKLNSKLKNMVNCLEVVRSIAMGSLRVIHITGLLVLIILRVLARYMFNHLGFIKYVDRLYAQPFETLVSTSNLIDVCILVFGLAAAIFQHKTSLRLVSTDH